MTLAAAISSPRTLAIPGLGVLACGDPNGDPVVFLHGWGGSKELWWNSQARLAGHLRSYALDLPGTGETALTHRFDSMSELAAWTYDTLRRLKIDRPTLIGHSLGGNLAAQMALNYPEFVRRLVLVDAALATKSLPRRVYWTQSAVYGLPAIRAMRAATTPLAAAGRRVPHNHNGGFLGPLARRAGMLVWCNKDDDALQWQLRLLCGNPIGVDRLRAVAAPILIVHGTFDAIVPVATAKKYAAELPGCAFKLFPTSHHCPMDHSPNEFVATVQEFIERHP